MGPEGISTRPVSETGPTTTSQNGWPRHVCLVRDKLVGPAAGAERVFVEQAATFVDAGVRCTVVLFEIDESLREQLPSQANTVVLGDWRYGDLLFLPKLVKLARFLRREKPDCVIAHQNLGDYLRWALLGTGIPYFVLKWVSNFYLAYDTTKYSLLYRNCFDRVRGSLPAYAEGVPQRWHAGLVKRLINEYYALRDWLGARGARDVFVMTSQSQWELQQMYNIDPIVWTPGLRQSMERPPRDRDAIHDLRGKYRISEGQPVLLSVNRLEYRKRVDLVVEAFQKISMPGPRPKLVIVGSGEERGALVQQVNNAGLADDVVFAGYVDNRLLAQHYHMCDIVVSMAWGSWSIAVVEPLAYDKRMLISDEIPDLLDGIPNVYRAKPEPLEVATGIQRALLSAPGNSADAVGELLDWSRQMEHFLSHIRASRKNGGASGSAAHADRRPEG